jgi:phospholipase A-2-activating protein
MLPAFLLSIPCELKKKPKTGLVVTGGQDKLILVHTPEGSVAPLLTLVGHEGNVCALDAVPGFIASGSWDMWVASLWLCAVGLMRLTMLT